MTESSVFPVWRNSQFIHHCSDASVNDKGVNRMKEQSFENVMAYVIKNPFFFRKIHLFQTAQKNLPNKYFNFGQLLLSSVVNIGELLFKQATSYSISNTAGSVRTQIDHHRVRAIEVRL